ncbi:MAG: thiamine pyrophosphate-binding protein [Bryobacteraceae bacterium]
MGTNADVIAQALAARGVEYVFGLPGGEILAFIDACRRAGLRFLLTGHEASGAFAAQVLGDITGVPGVCASTLGPGAANLVTGVANASLDRSPLLAITAEILESVGQTMTHQRLPLQAMFSPITKGSVAVGNGDTRALVDDALTLAARPRCGPVHMAMASDVAVRDCMVGNRRSEANGHTNSTGNGIAHIAARLEAARHPLVLVGLEAKPLSARAIGALIETLEAPFLVTPKAKGIVTEDHPLFLGVASGMAIDREILETIRAADLILAVGFDPVECDKTWFASADVVSLDAAPMAEGDYRPFEVLGEVGTLASALAASVAGPKPWPAKLIDRRRAAITREPRQRTAGLSPLRVIQELRSVLPRNGVAACDVGSHKLAIGQFWRAYEPGTFFMSNGLSSMGFGIPAAIAAQLAYPARPVLAMVGDGGMLMMMHNLTLVRELKLPIVTVVFTDRSLSLIRVSGERRGLMPYGVDFTPPDFVAVASAFGISGARVSSIPELHSRFEQALEQRVPCLIEAPIDYAEYRDLV